MSKTSLLTKTMRAAQLEGDGGAEALRVRSVLKPELAAGKILIQVQAAGVNPIDYKLRSGQFRPDSLHFPATLGSDFAGIVAELGSGLTDLQVGDEVYGQAGLLMGGSGSFAEFLLADSQTVALKPERINHLQAAALPLTGVSALQALCEHLKLKRRQKILIHGGAGGIGTVAIQLAKYLGAFVATTISAHDHDYVVGLGGDEIIDYHSQPFEELISGFDAVLDTIGGDTYTRSFQVLRPGGTIVSMLEQPNQQLCQQHGVKAIFQLTEVNRERLNRLAELADQGVIKENIDRVYPLIQTAEALSYLEHKGPKGKVLIEI